MSADPVTLDPAFRRIVRGMAATAAIATVALAIAFGLKFGGGVLLGCAVAALNLWWLKRAVHGFADRATQAEPESARKTRPGLWFLLRYALMAAVAYVILKSSVVSLSGFFCGLFLPVPAIMMEAIYETAAALRHREP